MSGVDRQLKVIDNEPYVWFLLQQEDRYYLDARASRSAVEWSVLVELTPEEREEYHARGKVFLDELASRIDNFPAKFTDRNLTNEMDGAVLAAIEEWKEIGA